MIDVSIIFVNYKTSDFVRGAIRSIRERSANFSYEIIVVDNSESKEEFNKLSDLKCENVHLIESKTNLGFGKANNLGSQFAMGKYLFFLNADTILINNAIYELKMFLDHHNDVGIVGSNLYTRDGKPNHSYFPYEKNIKGEKKAAGFLTILNRKIFGKRIDFNYTNKPKKIDGYVCGASLMIRKDLFEELDGFDIDIFMYAEESLLCRRVIQEKEFKIYNVPSSQIIHFEGGSFEDDVSYKRIKMMADGNYIYYKKAYGTEIAEKYLSSLIKMYRLKKNVSKILIRKKYNKFSIYEKAYQDKFNEIKSI